MCSTSNLSPRTTLRAPRLLLGLVIGITAVGISAPRQAVADGRGAVTGAFAQLEPGGRGAALAGALGPIIDSPAAIFWNPTGLLRCTAPGAEVTYADLFGLGLVHHTGVYLVYPRFRHGLTWDAGQLAEGDEEPSMAWGFAIEALGVDLDPESYSEYNLALALARRSRWQLSYAVVGHLLIARSGLDEPGADATGRSLDLAIARPLVPGLRGSLVLKSLLSSVHWDNAGREGLSPRLQLGLGWTPRRHLSIPCEAVWDLDRDLLVQVAAAVEWFPRGRVLALRGGLRWRDDGLDTELLPGAGVGLHWKQIVFDYGLAVGREELGDTHRFSLRYQF